MQRFSHLILRLATPAASCALAAALIACTGGGGNTGGNGFCNPAFTDAGCPDAGDTSNTNNATTDPDAGNTTDTDTNNNGTNNNGTNNGTTSDTTDTGTTGTTSETTTGTTGTTSGPSACDEACALLDSCDFLERSGIGSLQDCTSMCDDNEGPFAQDALTCLDGATCDTALACVFDGDPCEGVTCDGANEICTRPSGACAEFACQDDPFEPNNDARDATTLASEDLLISDLTTCGPDADLYIFSIPPNTDARIDVLFEHARGDIDVELSDERFQSVQVRGSSQDDNEIIFIPRYVEEQTYGLRVGAWGNDENFYDLRLEIDPPGIACRNSSHCPGDTQCDLETNTCDTECTVNDDCTDGFVCDSDGTCIASSCDEDPAEPNNDENEAYALSEGTLESLSLCLDDDYYTVEITENNTSLFIGLTHAFSDADIDMVLRNSQNQTILRAETESDDEFIFAQDLPADTYTLRVYSGDETLGAPYSLEVLINPGREICDRVECSECFTDDDCFNGYTCDDTGACVPGFCDEDPFEPNDDAPATLTPGTYDNLSICTRDDNDYFNFTLNSTSDVWLFIDYEIGLGDLDITVHDSNDNIVARRETTSRDEALSLLDLPADTYTLRVYTTSLDLNTPYILSYAVNPSFTLCEDTAQCGADEVCTDALVCRGPGECDYSSQCADDTPACDSTTNTCVACEGDALEPNDNFDQARPIESIASRTLNTCGGDDVFSIELEAGQLTRIDVLFEHNDGDIDALLLDANNNIVERSESGTSNEIFSFQPETSGTYYILVYGYEGTYNTYGIQVRYD